MDETRGTMDANLIYDVGMHKGEDAEFYLKKGFRVVAVEAAPSLCASAQERLRTHINSGQLTVVNAAIADTDGPLTFFFNESLSVWGTVLAHWAKRNERMGATSKPITVEGTKFEHLIKRFGTPYYLKIDIEGADLLCLKGLLELKPRPKYISIESTKTSWLTLAEEFDLFRALGYSKFKVVQQRSFHKERCPFPAREGRYVDHHFEEGSSGPFGEEAPGEWMSEAQALAAYRQIFARYRLYGDDSLVRRVCRSVVGNRLTGHLASPGWYDTHAAQ